MNESRKRTLTYIALGLVAARFVILPWIDHQSSERDSLLLLTQRLDRAESLVRSERTISSQAVTIEQALQQLRVRFPEASSADEYRLVIQEKLGAMAQQKGLLISVFDFLDEQHKSGANLQSVRVRIQFQGPLNSAAHFHGEIEGELPNVVILVFQVVSQQTPIPEPSNAGIQGVLVADFYFRAQSVDGGA